MTFGERLTLLRKEKGYMTRNEFADRLGIPSTTLRNYETDVREPGHTFLKKISEMFNVSVDYLMGLTDEPEVLRAFRLRSTEQDMIEKYRSLDPYEQETISLVIDREIIRTKSLHKKDMLIAEKDKRIAELESKPTNIIEFSPHKDNFNERFVAQYYGISAGTGIYIMGNDVTDQIPIPNTPENRCVDYAIKVSGDSMEPEFHDGDTALVSQKAELSHGDIGIFIINGSAFIKEYGEIELISHNPKHDNIKISEYDNIVCMGKVVGKLI